MMMLLPGGGVGEEGDGLRSRVCASDAREVSSRLEWSVTLK